MKRRKLRKGQRVAGCLMVAVFTLLLIGMAEAKDFCVSTAGELQNALTEAVDNGQDDVILIVQGTYNGNFTYDSTQANSLAMKGGYTGGCTDRMVDPTNTVLDARDSGTVLWLNTPWLQADYLVDGLTIQNGRSSCYGGGLYIRTSESSVTVSNSRFINNSTSYCVYGGGVYVNSAEIVDFANNIVIHNSRRGVTILSAICNLDNNIITNTSRGPGLIIIGPGGSGPSQRTIVINNTINNNKGGVVLNGNEMNFSNNIVNNNTRGGTIGGLFLAVSKSAIIVNNLITNNGNADEGGGIRIFASRSSESIVLTNNTIYNNSSLMSGGGIWLLLDLYQPTVNPIVDIFNNIIYGNSSEWNYPGTDLYINNDLDGDRRPSGTVNLFNNDLDQSAEGTYIRAPFPIDPSNLDNIDPLFVDPANGDYHLTSGSPCQDAGTETAPELPDTDFEGNPRIVGYAPDMGADEFYDILVNIDIKPSENPNDPNTIKLKNKKNIAVALLGSETFDVWNVDPDSLKFMGEPTKHDLADTVTFENHIEDVNGDGFDDLVAHFGRGGLDASSTEAYLAGITISGDFFWGKDQVVCK